mgnify:CR=1 FL=1
MGKTALILPGGGTRGVIHGGACLALEEMGIHFDLLVCASVGVCTGIFASTGQVRQSAHIWKNHIHGNQFIHWSARCIPHMNFRYLIHCLRDKAGLTLAHIGKHGELIVVLTDLQTGNPLYITLSPQSELWRIVRASIAVPLLSQPIEIDGRMVCDGGAIEPIPLAYALKQECTDITVVHTYPRSWQPSDRLWRVLGTFLPPGSPATQAVMRQWAKRYRESCQLMENPPSGVRIRTIWAPERPSMHFLSTNREILEAWFTHGYREAYRMHGQTAPPTLSF